MKAKYLVHRNWRPVGLILFLLGTIFLVFSVHNIWEPFNLTITNPFYQSGDGKFQERELHLFDELCSLSVILGLFFLGFSREKREDEWSSQIRLESLQFSVLLSSILLMLAIVFIHGLDFIYVMGYSMYLPLFLFVLRYYVVKWRTQSDLKYEE